MKKNSDVFTLPDLNPKNKGNTKKIIIISSLAIIILVIVVILAILKNKSDSYNLNSNPDITLHYFTGIEGKLEAIIFNLHNGVKLPDSIKYIVNNTIYTEKGNKYICDYNKLHQFLISKGPITSINLENRTYKDKDITSWIYRVIYKNSSASPIFAEYMMDVQENNGIININSLELISENIPDIISEDTAQKKIIDTVSLKKKEESPLKADSLAALRRMDSLKAKPVVDSTKIKKKKYESNEKEKPARIDTNSK